MKFICTQDNLVKGLSKVTPIAGRNRQLPVLDNVLLRLQDGVLNLTSTDLEVGVYTIVPGKVEEEGTVAVPARKFLEFVQQLPSSEPLRLESQEKMLRVVTKGYKAVFTVGNEDDFPMLPQKPTEGGFSLPADKFCQALNRTVFAAARDEVRPEIHSIFLSFSNDKVIMAATDSFRLVEEGVTVSSNERGDIGVLLPLNSAQEIIRLFSDQKDVTFIPGDSLVSVVGVGIEFSSRLVEGKYPDYKQIIPSKFVVEGQVNKEELTRALKTLSVFLPRDTKRIKMNIQPGGDKVVLQVVGSETGEGRAEIAFSGEGEDVEALFNIQYLLEGAQHLPGNEIKVGSVGNNGPTLFKPVEDDIVHTYIVMPIQVT